VPPLLLLLLKRMNKPPLKQAGQRIVQAVRPQGCLMPLLIGVAVDLDQCGVQQLHMKLSGTDL